jgi:hypothetical protein
MIRARISLCTLIALAAALSFTLQARAGSPVLNPHDVGSCGDLNHAGDGMDDPNTFNGFLSAGPEGCVKLCKQAEKECRDFAKRVSSCRLKFNDVGKDYANKSCEVNFEGSDVKACKREVSDSAKNTKENEQAARDVADSGCQAWEVVCANHCNQP